ncbi:MAG: ubiquinone-binding protein [Rhodobacterales bacterium]|nr:MAG: ubiquinone-binding protein [Rhodobacterales bacterium]
MPTQGEKKILPYRAEQMYELAADVAAYPQFLPWISASRIRSHQVVDDHEVMLADLVISFKVFRERFGSKVVLRRQDHRIEMEYLDGPFKYLQSYWQFTDQEGGGCEVDFFVDFEFKNLILQKLIGVVFTEAVRRTMRAFEDRAKALYGAG